MNSGHECGICYKHFDDDAVFRRHWNGHPKEKRESFRARFIEQQITTARFYATATPEEIEEREERARMEQTIWAIFGPKRGSEGNE